VGRLELAREYHDQALSEFKAAERLPEDSLGAALDLVELQVMVAEDKGDYHQAVARQPLTLDGKDLAMTLTAGVTELTAEVSIDEVIRRADHVLYRGKKHGKDRVEEFDPVRDRHDTPDS